MTRLRREQIEDAMRDIAPAIKRAARADNQLWRRGVMFVQKLWRQRIHGTRVNAPLPYVRGKR